MDGRGMVSKSLPRLLLKADRTNLLGSDGDQFISLAYVLPRLDMHDLYHTSLGERQFHLHFHGFDHSCHLPGLDPLADSHRQGDQLTRQRRAYNQTGLAII